MFDVKLYQVTPSHVSLQRGRGSCLSNPAFSCKAKSSTTRSVFRTGIQNPVCTQVIVREDTQCEVEREECLGSSQLHLYNNQTCS